MVPEESLYVIFWGTEGGKPGFWCEDSWGACNRMLLYRNDTERVQLRNPPRLHSLGVLPLVYKVIYVHKMTGLPSTHLSP